MSPASASRKLTIPTVPVSEPHPSLAPSLVTGKNSWPPSHAPKARQKLELCVFPDPPHPIFSSPYLGFSDVPSRGKGVKLAGAWREGRLAGEDYFPASPWPRPSSSLRLRHERGWAVVVASLVLSSLLLSPPRFLMSTQ